MDCPRHSGQSAESNREPYEDRVMRHLPHNQSGEGRHKCPYCAYERGRADYRKLVAEWLGGRPEELPDYRIELQ